MSTKYPVYVGRYSHSAGCPVSQNFLLITPYIWYRHNRRKSPVFDCVLSIRTRRVPNVPNDDDDDDELHPKLFHASVVEQCS